MNKNQSILSDDNVGRLLVKLSTPAMIGMIVMSMYNVVDTIFVGRGVGTLGIAGVAVVFPIQMIVGAIGQLFGIGGASLLSRSLGEGNIARADKTLNNVFNMVIIVGVTIAVIGYAQMSNLLALFGATDEIMPYARDYMVFIIGGLAFQSLSMALNNIVRAEGHAKVAMYSMVIPAVTNIILDAVFIFGFDMGISGAALATLISYIIGSVVLISFFFTGKSVLTVYFKLDFDRKILYEIFTIGVSSFIRQTAMSLLVIIINNKLALYGGNIAIAVYGVVMKLVMLIFTPILGIAQGLQPIVGFNYGAGNMAKMKKSLKLAVIYATVLALAGTLVIMIFPSVFIRLFSDDPELIEQTKTALRFLLITFPTVGFQIVGTTLFQATGKASQTLLLSMSRQILFLIPLMLFLPDYFALTGVWVSFPIADSLAALLTLYMVLKYKKLYNETAIKVQDGN